MNKFVNVEEYQHLVLKNINGNITAYETAQGKNVYGHFSLWEESKNKQITKIDDNLKACFTENFIWCLKCSGPTPVAVPCATALWFK